MCDPESDRDRLPNPNRAPVRRASPYRAVMGACILLCAGAISWYWLKHRPRSRHRRPAPRAALVRVITAKRGGFKPELTLMGTVIPARRVELGSRVGGEVTRTAAEFAPGGRFSAGDVMLAIDQADFRLALRQRQAAVAQAEAAAAQHRAALVQARCRLNLEMGQQQVAREDYRLLGHKAAPKDEGLILRRPQLASARAAVDLHAAQLAAADSALQAARAALARARLDLERTRIRAPFNCVLLKRLAERGSQVRAGQALALVAGTDTYWVEASVPVDLLRWIRVPRNRNEHGARVRVAHAAAWGESWRRGEVRRLEAGLETGGRMARLIVSVDDPLSLLPANRGKPRMLLDLFVRLRVAGRPLAGVFVLPAAALRDEDTIWIMRPDPDGGGTLEIRKVDFAWRDREHVCLAKGLAAGERIVVSDLAAPVAGMRLRVEADGEKSR